MPKRQQETSPTDGPVPLRFFDGFAWALPGAFASALASFRFEQGDVLHPSPSAYDPIVGREALAEPSIQVLQPPRSARTLPTGDGETDRRAASWRSEVELVWIEADAPSPRSIETTQGRLLMLLWTGERQWLDTEYPEPPVPESARTLAKHLEVASAAFDEQADWAPGVRFLFVIDPASDASRLKARAVEEALGGLGALQYLDLSPPACAIDSAGSYHPTLAIRALGVAGATIEDATEVLRRALYVGGARGGSEAATDGEPEDAPAKDRFSVGRHGLLEPIEAA